jgi:acetate CoA/acetoacetate CoA-transferase beta subunit
MTEIMHKMDAAEVIQRRIAQEIHEGMLVNLGIGIPTGVTHYVSAEGVMFQSENGLIGTGAPMPEGMEVESLVDAGGGFVSAVPGAATIDSAMSFALIRGGHLDMTVLGGMQVDEKGQLANWMVPGQRVAGMGGAMDLVSGAKRVIVAMKHSAKGNPKIVKSCTLPLTSIRRVSLVVTELAVIEPTDEGLVLREHAPGVTVADIEAVTQASLIVSPEIKQMELHH